MKNWFSVLEMLLTLHLETFKVSRCTFIIKKRKTFIFVSGQPNTIFFSIRIKWNRNRAFMWIQNTMCPQRPPPKPLASCKRHAGHGGGGFDSLRPAPLSSSMRTMTHRQPQPRPCALSSLHTWMRKGARLCESILRIGPRAWPVDTGPLIAPKS